MATRRPIVRLRVAGLSLQVLAVAVTSCVADAEVDPCFDCTFLLQTREDVESSRSHPISTVADLTPALLQMEEQTRSKHSSLNYTDGLSIPGVQQNMIPVGHLRPAAAFQGTFMIAGVDTGIMSNEVVQQLGVPVVALTLGLCLYVMKTHPLIAHLLVFFGAQTFMNLYMKIVLSRCVVSSERGLVGIPAPFFITAVQQVVAFAVLMCMAWVSAFKLRPLRTRTEMLSIVALSVCFTLNIALNNFSMALLDLSVNLMIRSIAPLTTYLGHLVVSRVMGTPVKAKHVKSIVLLIIGVICGALVVFAKTEANGHGGPNAERRQMHVGIAPALLSLLAAASEVNVVNMMGSGTRFNALEACCYMALPSALQLLPPVLWFQHTVTWSERGTMSDFAVIREVFSVHPRLIVLVLLSGPLALAYNVVLYNIVQALSPTHAVVASNLNKMAVIAISYIFAWEVMPSAPWNVWLVLGVLGNGLAFSGFGYIESAQQNEEAITTNAADGRTREFAEAKASD